MLTKLFLRHNSIHIAFLLGVALLMLSACNGGATDQNAAAVPTSSTVTSASAFIRHSPSGTAILRWNHATHDLNIQLALTGLAPKSVHSAVIMSGSCKSSGGKVLYTLPQLSGSQIGFANVKTTLKDVSNGIPETGWSVIVNSGSGTTNADQANAITCADVFNPTASTSSSQSVTATLLNAFGTNQNVNGTADLVIKNHQLRVTVKLKGLAPRSTHMAHIHYGSCASQGSELYGLKPIVADATGDGTSLTLLPKINSIPRNGWYINIHQGAAAPKAGSKMQGSANMNIIACGDITQFH